jgi:hypothetical protein
VFDLHGEKVLHDWLAKQSDSACREQMIEWMSILAEDPVRLGARVPGSRAQVFIAVTPVGRWYVKYLVAHEYNTINLLGFDQLE